MRRILSLLIFLSLLGGGFWLFKTAWNPKSPAKPPNVLFIVIDDLNRQVGFLGDDSAVTPSLDALARSSVVFEHAYAQAPLCNPSRTSFLTGTYPHTTGIYGLSPNFWDLDEFEPLLTLPLHFRNAGYTTRSMGKVFHTASHEPSFDHILRGWFGAFGPFPTTPLNLGSDGAINRYYDWGPWQTESETPDYQLATKAARFIEDADELDKPFFLAVGFFRPHTPLFAPQEFFDLHQGVEKRSPAPGDAELPGVPAFGKKLVSYFGRQKFNNYLMEKDQGAGFLQAYRAAVSLVDKQVGRVMHALAQSGELENTIVVLLGDHGVQNGEKNLWFKRTLWEASTHVPMMISVPGESASRIQMPVGLIDIFPTLSELLGLPVPEQLQGHSLLPWMTGELSQEQPREPVLSVHGPGNFALRDSRWRYIRYAEGSEELYDHQVDEGEHTNLVMSEAPSEDSRAALERLRTLIPDTFREFAPGTEGFASGAYPGK